VVETPTSFLAECFWPGVRDADLAALEERAYAAAEGEGIRYLGSILVREDEVVLCLFEGPADAVQRAVASAAIPYERILATTHSNWPVPTPAGQTKGEDQ